MKTSDKSHKYLIIPDVHQDLEWVSKIFLQENRKIFNKIIFLGDYFDSFREDVPSVTATLSYLIKLKEEFGDRVELLAGNHDIPYLYRLLSIINGKCPHFKRYLCSGYTQKKCDELIEVAKGNEHFIQTAFKLLHTIVLPNGERLLLTHAGLHSYWYKRLATLNAICTYANISFIETALNHWFQTQFYKEGNEILEPGFSRGGSQPVGGITWMDESEYAQDYTKIPINQIFGHTARRNRFVNYNRQSFCIDGNQTLYAVLNKYSIEIKTTENSGYLDNIMERFEDDNGTELYTPPAVRKYSLRKMV